MECVICQDCCVSLNIQTYEIKSFKTKHYLQSSTMEHKNEDRIKDVDLNNAIMTFDNLTILKEFGNIANLVRDQDFLETVPKAKLRRVKWVQMFNCLKQGILDDMLQELNSMWEYEEMSQKLDALEKQKEKFSQINPDQKLWRPQLGDVKSQLKAHDAVNLQKQKKLLESLAKEYEVQVNRLKKNVAARRGYLKAMQIELQKSERKSHDLISVINDKLKSHDKRIDIIFPMKDNIEDIGLLDIDLEVSDRDST